MSKSIALSEIIQLKGIFGITYIRLEEILLIKANNKHSIVILVNKKEIESVNNLGWFDTILPKPCFYRCHKTYLINCRYFVSINNSTCLIALDGNFKIPISRYKKKQFITNIISYISAQ